jgi:hypothetical protein
MFNALDVYMKEKGRYGNLRGSRASSSGVFKGYPRTTWKDVYRLGTVFLAKTSNYARLKCLAEHNMVGWELMSGVVCPTRFTETSSYKNARTAFEQTMPFPKLFSQNPMTAPALLAAKGASNEEYPWNEEFWLAFHKYAVARNAAGMVQGKWTMAREAIIESIEELPERIVAPLAAAMNLVPSFDMEKIMLWSIVGVGGYFIVKMVMDKRRKKA